MKIKIDIDDDMVDDMFRKALFMYIKDNYETYKKYYKSKDLKPWEYDDMIDSAENVGAMCRVYEYITEASECHKLDKYRIS